MADKLEWMNQHLVLLKYQTVSQTVTEGKYKLPPNLETISLQAKDSSEEFIRLLEKEKKYKEACDFLAYAMHRRAAVWWGYRCGLHLMEELQVNPIEERDIADIGAEKPFTPPDWTREPPEPPIPEEVKQAQELFDNMDEIQNEILKDMPPELREIFDEAMKQADANFKNEYGMTMMDAVKRSAEKAAQPSFEIDPESPIFKMEKDLRDEIEAKRKETVDLIKTVLPPPDPAHVRKIRKRALDAVYQWVIAPDEINSKEALEAGNACPDNPSGLLALTAFWSFGNLSPVGTDVILTPPGLAANGLCAALLQMALSKGGTKKYAERFEEYFSRGIEVCIGKNNWEASLANREPPHIRIGREIQLPKFDAVQKPTYVRWKPNIK